LANDKEVEQPELKIRRTPSESSRPADILARYNGLPENIRQLASLPGWRACMQCQGKFYSADVSRIRTCDACKQTKQSGLREIPVKSIGVADMRDPKKDI
jgi:hypothetical protein